MNLHFNKSKASSYDSKSQIARVLSEDWVKINGYCPNCGKDHLPPFENNRPVAAPLLDGICNPGLSGMAISNRLFYNIRIANPNEQSNSKLTLNNFIVKIISTYHL